MNNPKIILGIETSCDETAAAVGQMINNRVYILSNVVASSLEIQAKYGGVVPEQAAREQLKSIIPVITEALRQAQCKPSKINAIAVTQGPGLIGSLLVGVETAKTLALVWNEQSSSASQNKPLVPINHLIGHFYANWINPLSLRDYEVAKQSQIEIAASQTPRNDAFKVPSFPCLGLLVSGGHTDLILMQGHGKYEYLGGTRDDAAGECFDKCARLLGLPYPGGPAISKLAKDGNPKAFNLPRPMMKDFSAKGGPASGWDFSFSGLKTAVANLLQGLPLRTQGEALNNFCASIEAAIVDVLVKKTVAAAQHYQVEQIIVAGGVAANQTLAEQLARAAGLNSLSLFIPPPLLCTDNAAMITAAAFYNYHPVDPLSIQANPNLSLSH